MNNSNKRFTEAECMSHLWALLEDEHCNQGCEQNTCDISVAYRLGYIRWAAEVFAGCGAASDEFLKWYGRLPKVFAKRAEAERVELCKEDHAPCPHCNAVVWLPNEVTTDGMIYCDSCARDFKREQSA
jgi:hypothetical protein